VREQVWERLRAVDVFDGLGAPGQGALPARRSSNSNSNGHGNSSSSSSSSDCSAPSGSAEPFTSSSEGDTGAHAAHEAMLRQLGTVFDLQSIDGASDGAWCAPPPAPPGEPPAARGAVLASACDHAYRVRFVLTSRGAEELPSPLKIKRFGGGVGRSSRGRDAPAPAPLSEAAQAGLLHAMGPLPQP
jgi:hypothetical protein